MAIFVGLPFFGYFAFSGNSLRGLLSSLSAGVAVVVFTILRNMTAYVMFWVAMVSIVVFHTVAILSIHRSDSHFSWYFVDSGGCVSFSALTVHRGMAY
jgi:hypothetical protein